MTTERTTFSMASALDDAPVIERNAGGASPFFLACDHYGNRIPPGLGDLGIGAADRARHIAWDIGIAGVAERLSDALDAHLVAQRYSRLVIDCNRPTVAASSIPEVSDGTPIPANAAISRAERARRRALIFEPYHAAIEAALKRRIDAGRPTILIALHSFTPVFGGFARPWHVGTLYHTDRVLPPLLLAALRAEPDLVVGDNQPYAVHVDSDYTIPVHGEGNWLVACGIEIRQDLIADSRGQQRWAERLARVLAGIGAQIAERAAAV